MSGEAMTPRAAMVRLSGVSKSYGPVAAVQDVHLDLEPGKILALLGPSGCGKTTTLRLLAGFEHPDAGEVEIGGKTVAGKRAFVPPEKRKVGMVFQDYALFPHLTVEQNIAYGLQRSGKRKGRVAEVLGLAHLDGLGGRMPHELSGGQQQRVALARALAPEPAVVLLDEPFSNLDATLRARVRSEMREILRDAGVTAIFVTHDQEEALSIADEVAVMIDGRVLQKAPPEDLYLYPATREVAEFVGEANFIPGTAENGRVRCVLGDIPALETVDGAVEVMLRPESLLLRALPDGEATVVGREFYGHDQLVELRLDSGETLYSRLVGRHGFEAGERVSLGAWGPVVVFPSS
ncbi:MAG TPA: ABC transporter ATP-binding protein [Rubrobacteraceae bacterium]|nr:ABC transporter ATP-binding protein [Rubrobacteraceae bacterium]